MRSSAWGEGSATRQYDIRDLPSEILPKIFRFQARFQDFVSDFKISVKISCRI